jgi:hypothetical protein
MAILLIGADGCWTMVSEQAGYQLPVLSRGFLSRQDGSPSTLTTSENFSSCEGFPQEGLLSLAIARITGGMYKLPVASARRGSHVGKLGKLSSIAAFSRVHLTGANEK